MGKRATERSAACNTCGKTFSRSDTLLRHEKSHHATEDRGPIHRVTNGTFRACCACAQARSRCSGGSPCGRCKTRSLECIYPNKRRKGNYDDEDSQAMLRTVNMSTDQQDEASKVQHPLTGQFQQFVFASGLDSSYPGHNQPDAGKMNLDPEVPRLQQVQTESRGSMAPSATMTPGITLEHPSGRSLATNHTNSQAVGNVTQYIPNPDHFDNASAPIVYQDTFDTTGAYSGPELFDGSFNLNWIPLSVYPSPYGNMEQDFSFLIPSMSDTASLGNEFDPLSFNASLSTSNQGRQHDHRFAQSSQYQIPPSMAGLMRSPASTGSESIAPTGFAFDNIDIPGSKKKRRKSSVIPTGFPPLKDRKMDFAFPDTSSLLNIQGKNVCSEAKYASILATFQLLCVKSSRWKPFSSSRFPRMEALNTCIDLYFEHLHPTFPLLHAATFEENGDWLTCLATAAIGCTFASIHDREDAREAFQEFLRRAVLATSDEHDGDFRNIHLAQARILALVGLTQSDNERLRSRAPRSHVDIARWCLESGILQLTARDEEVGSDKDIGAAWKRWIERESLRRVGYFIWYLDCALGYLGNARPLCNMDDARAPLPCPEALWDATSAQQWLVHRNNTPSMPSLCEALDIMYTKKKIDPGLSEIAQILLIHALYSRTWEVGTHIKQPLSEWKATGSSKGFLNTPSKDNFWLPLYPLYANWRNSACDCLDVLHWQALATMAKHVGVEHHGVLHLHLARVILLTPFQEIQDLLFFLINHRVSDLSKASFYVHDGSYQPRNPAKLTQIRKITWRWLCEDQHKARLAMIHAGSVFWHIRRSSTYSFFEPLAIYLATIVLWTYGSYKSAALERHAAATGAGAITDKQHLDDRSDQIQTEPGSDFNVQPTRVERAARRYADSKSRSSRSRSGLNPSTASNSPAQTRGHAEASNPLDSHTSPSQPFASYEEQSGSEEDDEDQDEDGEEQPQFINLDRPVDDDLVQHFVRNGHNMSGYMTNVGDICKTPQKVLLEGAKILRTKLACWGVSREYHDILVRLAEVRKDKSGGKAG